jgi:hypothetical protein
MTPLKDALLKATEFDREAHLAWLNEERAKEHWKFEPSPQAGARWQHAQMLPLLQACAEVVEALECVAAHDKRLPDFTDNPQTIIAHEALATLRERLKGMKK